MGAFTGKTVLILGGSRGIGAAIVSSPMEPMYDSPMRGRKMPLNAWHMRLERQQYSQIALTETLLLMSFVRAAHWISWW